MKDWLLLVLAKESMQLMKQGENKFQMVMGKSGAELFIDVFHWPRQVQLILDFSSRFLRWGDNITDRKKHVVGKLFAFVLSKLFCFSGEIESCGH